jgi:type I restriction enzyme S subunit
MDYLKLVEAQCGLQPKHWKCIRMGDIVSDGPQNGLYKHLSHYGQGTPIVRIDDYPNEGGVIKSANHRLTLSDSDRITYSLRTGDLLVNRVNSLSHIGKTALVGELEESIVFESNMMRFAVRRELVSPFFVYLFLNTSEARKELRGRAKRAVAQSSINQGDLMSLMVPIPPLDEQNQIVEQINALVNKVKTEEKHVIALTTLLQSLLNGLLTEKMRVREFVNNESQS